MKGFEDNFAAGIGGIKDSQYSENNNLKKEKIIIPSYLEKSAYSVRRRMNYELGYMQEESGENLKKYIGKYADELVSRIEFFLENLDDSRDINMKKYQELVDFLAEKVNLLEEEKCDSDCSETKGFSYQIERAYLEMTRALYKKGNRIIKGRDVFEKNKDLYLQIINRSPIEDPSDVKKRFYEKERNEESLRVQEKERVMVFLANILEKQAQIYPEDHEFIGKNSFNVCFNNFGKLIGEVRDDFLDKESIMQINQSILSAFDRKFSSNEGISDIASPDLKNNLIIFFSKYPDQSVNSLLNKLKTTNNELLKENYAEVICKIELGKIGISKDGVRYLQKVFDLQEANNPNFFVNRLTAKGDIGIFDENNVLQKYFNVGDLSSEEQIIKPKVLDFVYETLFMSKSNETPEARKEREKYLQEFKENYFGFYNEEFHQKTGVRFNNLDFKEQGQFLIYSKNTDPEKQEKLLGFVKNHGENGIKAFLSLEDGGQEMGGNILKIGEKIDQESADAIFARYSEIVSVTENIREYLKTFESTQEISDEEVKKISKQILVKANCLLINFAKRLETSDVPNKEEVLTALEDYEASVIHTFSAFKHLRDKVKLEDLRGVSYEKISQGDFSKYSEEITKFSQGEQVEIDESNEFLKNIQQMFHLYEENYKNRPEFKKILMEGFAKTLLDKNKTVTLNMLKKDDRLLGFNRVEEREDDKKYFGSCNVLPVAQALSIGKELFDLTYRENFIDNEVNATCDAFVPGSPASMYIERGDFVVEKIDIISDPDNIPWFVLKKEKENTYYYQGKDVMKLVKEAQEPESIQDNLEKMSRFVLSFSEPEKEKAVSSKLVNEDGYKITRYFANKKAGKIYLAFEKSSS